MHSFDQSVLNEETKWITRNIISRLFKFLRREHIAIQAGRQEQADPSRGISLLSVLCFCQRRKSRLSQSREAYFDLPEGDTTLRRLPSGIQTRGREGRLCRTVRCTRFRRDCSAAFTFDLPRRSVFNELPASPLCETRVSVLHLHRYLPFTWQHVSSFRVIHAYSCSCDDRVGVNETVRFTRKNIVKLRL